MFLTFGVKLCTILLKSFEPDSLSQKLKELLKGWTCRFVVVHLFLGALAGFAVHDAHFLLIVQLWRQAIR